MASKKDDYQSINSLLEQLHSLKVKNDEEKDAEKLRASAEERTDYGAANSTLRNLHASRVERAASVCRVLFRGYHLEIEERPGFSIGSHVWEVTLHFLKYLQQNIGADELRGKRVIELGSGCGVLGSCLSLTCPEVDVTLTDKSLGPLEANHRKILGCVSEEKRGTTRVLPLTWGDVGQIEACGPPFDYVIASEVVYDEGAFEALILTMIRLSKHQTQLILGYKRRSRDEDRFFDAISMHFEASRLYRSRDASNARDVVIIKFTRRPHSRLVPEHRKFLEGVEEAEL